MFASSVHLVPPLKAIQTLKINSLDINMSLVNYFVLPLINVLGAGKDNSPLHV